MIRDLSVGNLLANATALTAMVALFIVFAVAMVVVGLDVWRAHRTRSHRDPSRRSGLLHRERGRHAAPRRAIWRRGAA